MPVIEKEIIENRALGTFWETKFEKMITSNGFWCHRLQENRDYSATIAVADSKIIAPDVIFGRQGQLMFGEIKHKSPNKYSSFGLEEYRLKTIQTMREYAHLPYLYIIHDWKEAGGKEINENNIQHWYAQSFTTLVEMGFKRCQGKTYCNNTVKTVNICYFPKKHFVPLQTFLWLV